MAPQNGVPGWSWAPRQPQASPTQALSAQLPKPDAPMAALLGLSLTVWCSLSLHYSFQKLRRSAFHKWGIFFLSTPTAVTPFKFIFIFFETLDVVRLTSKRSVVTVVTMRHKETFLASQDQPGRSAAWPASEQSGLRAASFVLGRSSLSLE